MNLYKSITLGFFNFLSPYFRIETYFSYVANHFSNHFSKHLHHILHYKPYFIKYYFLINFLFIISLIFQREMSCP